MNRTFSTLTTLALGAFLLLMPQTALAQDGANADAREQYGAMIEEAGALAEMADGTSLLQAAIKYIEAAELAANSGDAELADRAGNAKEQAVKAYVDAGSVFASADNHEAAAEAFDKAADVAEELGDAELEAKAKYNASVAYVSLQNFENALGAIDRAIILIPSDLNYHYVKGITLRSAGNIDDAVMTFARLDTLALEAEDADMSAKARENLGKTHLIVGQQLLKDKNYRDAIAHLDQAAPYLGEDDRSLNLLYANAYYRIGADQIQREQIDSAETNLNKAKMHAEKAGQQKLVSGIQQQLDYIAEVRAHNQR